MAEIKTTSGSKTEHILSYIIRFGLISLGLAILLWVISFYFIQSEKFTQGNFIFPISIGIAVLIQAFTFQNEYRLAGLWFSLALIGQAAALCLINAGRTIHYQHYMLHQEWLALPTFWYLLTVLIQTGMVVWGLAIKYKPISNFLKQTFKLWQMILLALIFIFSSAAFSRVYLDYISEVFLAAYLQFLNLVSIMFVVFSISRNSLFKITRPLDRYLGAAEEKVSNKSFKIDNWVVICAFLCFFMTAGLSYFIYQNHPHIQDEVAYLYQAKYLSAGHLTAPALKAPNAFSIYMIPYDEARWYSPFPPGWPALLSLGVKNNIGWLVNPLLAGVNVILAYYLYRYLLPERYSKIAVLLMVCSPWLIFMGMNFMSHTSVLTCALAAGICVLEVTKSGKSIWAALAGVMIGVLSLIRNMDSLIVGGVLGIALFFENKTSIKYKAVAWYILGGLLVGGLILPYNRAITGDPFYLPLSYYYDKYFGPHVYDIGFGADHGLSWAIDPLPGYSPVEAVLNAVLNTYLVNIELFGWASGSLILVYLFLIWGYRNFNKTDYYMLAIILATIGVYALFWFNGGPDFGARYWYLISIPLIYFTVRAIQLIEKPVANLISNYLSNRIILVVICMCLISLTIYFPWRALNKYYQYLGMRPDVREILTRINFDNSLILIRGQLYPDYSSAWIYNPIDPDTNAPLFAFDQSTSIRSDVLEAYGDRPVWIIDGPSLTGDGYKIIAGPITSREALVFP